MITHERLLELCHYCPVSGLFTAKVGRAKRFSGTVMGTTNRSGYLVARMDRKLYYLHRLAYFYMTKEWPKEIDHINWAKSDNRWANLRVADRFINMRNLPARSRKDASIPVGVCLVKSGKWQAQVLCKKSGERKYLGRFSSMGEAANAVSSYVSAL